MQQLLRENKLDLALVVGNGINQYEAISGATSWDVLLTQLARLHIDPLHADIPQGVSPTEFFDILELAARKSPGRPSFQTQFCQQMSTWLPLQQHFRVTDWAKRWSIPVLTTNFEGTLAASASATLRRNGKDKPRRITHGVLAMPFRMWLPRLERLRYGISMVCSGTVKVFD